MTKHNITHKQKEKFHDKIDFSKKLRRIERMVNENKDKEEILRLLETCKDDVREIL